MSKKIRKAKKNVVKAQEIKKESFYRLFVKWLTWQKAGVILTGIGVFISLFSILPSFLNAHADKKELSEVDEIRLNINKNIKIIKDTFKPESIPDSLNIYPDVFLVKDFQNKVLERIFIWESIEKAPSQKEIAERALDSFFESAQNLYEKYDRDTTLILQVFNCIAELDYYGSQNNKDYKYDSSKETLLISYADARDIEEEKAKIDVTEKLEEILKKYDSHNKKAPQEDYELTEKIVSELGNSFKAFENLKTNPDFIRFDNLFYEFIIELNTKYMLSIKKYL